MPIHKPGRVLLHHIPLKFVNHAVAGGGRKAVDMQIPLIPFIDFLIVLVVFLLMQFEASGQMVTQQASIVMPNAQNTAALEVAPIISIDSRMVALDKTRVADYNTLAQTAQVDRIEQLIQNLEMMKRNWSLLHATEPFPGTVILQADKAVDFRVIKKVMFSASQAGYSNVSFAVNKVGD